MVESNEDKKMPVDEGHEFGGCLYIRHWTRRLPATMLGCDKITYISKRYIYHFGCTYVLRFCPPPLPVYSQQLFHDHNSGSEELHFPFAFNNIAP